MEEKIFKQSLPNAQTAYIMGILSIIFTFVTTIIGLILGIIAVVEGSKAIKLYESDPTFYNPKDYENAKTGKLLGWISIGISAFILFVILIIVLIVLSLIPIAMKQESSSLIHQFSAMVV